MSKSLRRRVSVAVGLVLSSVVLMQLPFYIKIAFPITQEATAIWLAPRLSKDMVCLAQFADKTFAAAFPLSYVNLLLWAVFSGFLAGWVLVGGLVRQVRVNLQPKLAEKSEMPPIQISKLLSCRVPAGCAVI